MTAKVEEPIPEGWKLWLEPRVPPELTKFAMAVRDKINKYPYGGIAEITTDPIGRTVGAFKSHHTWSFLPQSDGTRKLTTGLWIPGVSLVIKQSPQSSMGAEVAFAAGSPSPHPDAARFPVVAVPWKGVPLILGAVTTVGALALGLPVWAGLGAGAGVAWWKSRRIG